MFAEAIATEINWTLIATIIMAIGTMGMWLDSRKPRTTTLEPQPLAVEIVEELHEQFASKKEFDAQANGNTARHSQLFSQIDRVERELREASDRRFVELNKDRHESLEKLNSQFTFIRENIAAINRELQIRSQKK